MTKSSATSSPETRHRQFLAAYDALLAGWPPGSQPVDVRNVQVEVLPGASHHSIPVEHAGALVRLLLGFLPGVPAQEGT